MKVESHLSNWGSVTPEITSPRWRTKLSTTSNFETHFGGPDQPAGRLRDLLAEQIEAVPAGGAIDWITYYFRDRRLAEQLLRAHRRNVNVTVTLEGNPHIPHANYEVVSMLSGEQGLGKRFRTVCLPPLVPKSPAELRLRQRRLLPNPPRPQRQLPPPRNWTRSL